MGISCEVINIHTIKPLDEELILKSVNKTRCAISCEEHNIIGGLGESISRVLGEKLPVPLKIIGVNDSFGESGKPLDLLVKYKLDPETIKKSVLEVLERK
jgi:transketolase